MPGEVHEKAQDHRAETSALLEAVRAVLKYREFPEAARAIFDACKNLIGATAGFVALLAEDGSENEVLFLDSGGLSCAVDPDLPMPIRGLLREAYRNGKVEYDNDFFNSKRTKHLPSGYARLDNVLFSPLVIEGKTVGVIVLGNKPSGFTENDARVASFFGEFASVALHNSRTLELFESSEQRFRTLVETTSDWVWEVDAEGTYTYASPKVKDLLGYDPEEVLGKTPFDLMSPTEAERVTGLFREIVKSRKPFTALKNINLHKDGREVVLETSGVPILGAEGSLLGYRGIDRDITNRKRAEEDLQEREAELSAIFHNAPVAMILVDRERRVRKANRTAELTAGRSAEEMVGLRSGEALRCLHALDDTRGCGFGPHCKTCAIRSTVLDTFKTGKPHNQIEALVMFDRGSKQEERHLLVSTTLLAGLESGMVLVCIEDTTERKQAEEEIRGLAKFPGENPNPVLRVAKDGIILYANKASDYLLKAWGCQVGQHLPELWFKFVSDAYGSGSNSDVEVECADRIFSFTCAPVPDAGYTNLYGLDTTQRQHVEEALRSSERELTIYSKIADVFLTIDAQEMYSKVLEVILDAVQSKYGIFGYLNEDGDLVCPSMTKDIWERCQIPDKDIVFPRESWGGLWGRALKEKKTLYSNQLLSVPEGHIPVQRALSVPIIHQEKVIGLLLVANKSDDYAAGDVGLLESIASHIAPVLEARLQRDKGERERREAEEALRRARDELEIRVKERTAELSEANENLRKEMKERQLAEEQARKHEAELAHVTRLSTMGEMASGLAHELNQPLSAIYNYARACVRRMRAGTADEEELLEDMEQVAAQSSRAGEVIRRIRNFVRKGERRCELHAPGDIIREVIAFSESDVSKYGVALQLELEDGLPQVVVDGIQIEQVILNLVRNALEAMSDTKPNNRKLTIKASRNGDGMVEVAVRDMGPGISGDVLERLFDPFFTTKSDGMGMGLAISRSIIEAHGGRLWATSHAKQGCIFRFTLPIDDGG